MNEKELDADASTHSPAKGIPMPTKRTSIAEHIFTADTIVMFVILVLPLGVKLLPNNLLSYLDALYR